MILTRHADTDPGFGQLNATGRARAQALVDAVGDMRMDRHAGGVLLWVGNASGNRQGIYRRLGGTGMGPVEYGDLHILTISDAGPVGVGKKRYGPEP